MTQAVAREAIRLRRPSYRDPRLVGGILLVAGSVVMGAKVVSAFDDTTAHYVATRALAPGDRLRPADLQVVKVNLGQAESTYLAGTVPAEGLLVTQRVGAGGLVPVEALARSGDVGQQPVTLQVSAQTLAGITDGDVVDVWVSQPDPDHSSRYLRPELKVSRAQVRTLTRGGSALSVSGTDSSLTVLVPQAKVADLIGAMANSARISLVNTGGGQ